MQLLGQPIRNGRLHLFPSTHLTGLKRTALQTGLWSKRHIPGRYTMMEIMILETKTPKLIESYELANSGVRKELVCSLDQIWSKKQDPSLFQL